MKSKDSNLKRPINWECLAGIKGMHDREIKERGKKGKNN